MLTYVRVQREDAALQDELAHSLRNKVHISMLTYAHVCSRMLTYAHVCSRLLLRILTPDELAHSLRNTVHVERQIARMLTYADGC
jgi:hypothetical protein